VLYAEARKEPVDFLIFLLRVRDSILKPGIREDYRKRRIT
jgi:hypothetical protein